MGSSDRGSVSKRIHYLVWLEPKYCEAAEKEKRCHRVTCRPRDLLLHSALLRLSVAKPVTDLYYRHHFHQPGIQQQLGGMVLAQDLSEGHGRLSAGAAVGHRKAGRGLDDLLLHGGPFTWLTRWGLSLDMLAGLPAERRFEIETVRWQLCPFYGLAIIF